MCCFRVHHDSPSSFVDSLPVFLSCSPRVRIVFPSSQPLPLSDTPDHLLQVIQSNEFNDHVFHPYLLKNLMDMLCLEVTNRQDERDDAKLDAWSRSRENNNRVHTKQDEKNGESTTKRKRQMGDTEEDKEEGEKEERVEERSERQEGKAAEKERDKGGMTEENKEKEEEGEEEEEEEFMQQDEKQALIAMQTYLRSIITIEQHFAGMAFADMGWLSDKDKDCVKWVLMNGTPKGNYCEDKNTLTSLVDRCILIRDIKNGTIVMENEAARCYAWQVLRNSGLIDFTIR